MSQEPIETGNSGPFYPSLSISFDTNSNILDLSGNIPFKIYVDVSRRGNQRRRNPESHEKPIDILTNGSVLDISSALKAGLLSLVETKDNYPERKWQDCERQIVSKELYTDAAYDPLAAPPTSIRLRSGLHMSSANPQRIECPLDPELYTAFKDGAVYVLQYPSEADDGGRNWNGGITWWKLCTDPTLPADPSLPTDEPRAKILKAKLPRFRATSNTPRPPKIDFELDFSETEISLTQMDTVKISVRFWLRQADRYTVMSHKTTSGPKATVLASEGIGSHAFDIIDLDTGEILSGAPIYGNALWTPKLPLRSIKREQLRELTPDEEFTSTSIIASGSDKVKAFLKYFRIHDKNILVKRSLAVKLRPVQTFWSTKGIEELFEHEETIKQDYWYTPLTLESPAVAEFKVIP
jgi:hypothetical protein